jgi:G3E family GTPase/ubiquinone/menaquinone biosynthesis C-methylase UbiE
MKVHLLGGFLGAGKTSAIRGLAELLRQRGERVAIVTNDQGHTLVDTALCQDASDQVVEIGGGCFCCQYDDLDRALMHAYESGATVALAEAVGSCTDLVATVLSPLAERRMAQMTLAPFSVLVDPLRARDIADGGFHQDVAYLFRKQIEEADVVVLTRSDLDELPDAEPFIRKIRTDVPIVKVSSVTKDGFGEWLATMPLSLAKPLDIDYDRYAAAEALLGWANGRVKIHSDSEFSPQTVIETFFAQLAPQPIAHLKIFAEDSDNASGQLVRKDDRPTLSLEQLPEQVTELQLLVNARFALPPDELETQLRAAMDQAANGQKVQWLQLDCFKPGRPVPVHRYAMRCDPEGDGQCCAAFYQDPAVQYLLGDSYHPGGTKLTLELAASLGLVDGKTILDVACGQGTSLKAILAAHDVNGVGMDINPGQNGVDPATGNETNGERLKFVRGDVHQTDFHDERFDAILCECAVSTFADQGRALSEMYRLLKPGGRVAISDMLANGAIPEGLSEWVHLGTCLSHARSLEDYAALLKSAGFNLVAKEDSTWALRELIKQIKRRLLSAAVAKATGALSPDVDIDIVGGRKGLKEATKALDQGSVGYGYLVAEKPL